MDNYVEKLEDVCPRVCSYNFTGILEKNDLQILPSRDDWTTANGKVWQELSFFLITIKALLNRSDYLMITFLFRN